MPADALFTFPVSSCQTDTSAQPTELSGERAPETFNTMSSTEMMWRVLANGQKVMGRVCLDLASEAKTTEDVRHCVDLANKCALIESSCVEMAKRVDGGEA